MLRTRSLAVALVAVTALLASAGGAAPASAGDDPSSAVLLYSAIDSSGAYPVLATIPGSSTSVTVSGNTKVNLVPSASLDGSVVAYLVARTVAGFPVNAMVIRRDGRVIHRIRMGLDVGVFPRVSSDGSSVIYGGPGSLRRLDVATGTERPACSKCPSLSSIASASLSPDNSKIAIAHRTSGSNVIEVFNVDDGVSLAVAPLSADAGSGGVAWKPDGSAVAYSSRPQGAGPSNLGVIFTLTLDGRVAQTSFHQATSARRQVAFVSPFWQNDAVWAIRVTILRGKQISGRVVAASDWSQPFHAVGAALWAGSNEQQYPVWALSSWTNAIPAPARGQ